MFFQTSTDEMLVKTIVHNQDLMYNILLKLKTEVKNLTRRLLAVHLKLRKFNSIKNMLPSTKCRFKVKVYYTNFFQRIIPKGIDELVLKFRGSLLKKFSKTTREGH